MTLEIVKMETDGIKNFRNNTWEKYGAVLLDKTGFSHGLGEVGT